MKLCLCIIFKNEKSYLEDCLKSVEKIVDEAVLVDSESTDGSEEIARSFCQRHPSWRYVRRPWPNHFSEQKNFALSLAKAEWILFLDADERIAEQDHSLLLASLQAPDIKAYRLPIWNYTNDVTEWDFQPLSPPAPSKGLILTHLHRLFRRHPELVYTGRLHERIEPNLSKVSGRTSDLNVVIHHLGKLKEVERGLLKERYAFYEKLGRAKIEDHREDPQAHWELGSVLQRMGRFLEAQNCFEQAFQRDPSQEIYETSLFLSLLQQQKWSELKEKRATHPRGRIFPIIARAYLNAEALPPLESEPTTLYQLPLFLYEISLLHGDSQRIERYRKLADDRFAATGAVDLITGGFEQRRGDRAAAIQSYRKALEKKQWKALEPLVVLLGADQKFDEALELRRHHQGQFDFFVSEKTRALLDRVEAMTSR